MMCICIFTLKVLTNELWCVCVCVILPMLTMPCVDIDRLRAGRLLLIYTVRLILLLLLFLFNDNMFVRRGTDHVYGTKVTKHMTHTHSNPGLVKTMIPPPASRLRPSLLCFATVLSSLYRLFRSSGVLFCPPSPWRLAGDVLYHRWWRRSTEGTHSQGHSRQVYTFTLDTKSAEPEGKRR